ncbi:unnamed protein product [Ambrosiozyma monospora]|uniref:Unnamed protein product n=1 Tax=Ambrosiozyma monospora TaxID=43982 RepID=A0A9W6YVM9_AMBMO|nr:unnamed protein product [Ambrosiozyma monospora]
MPHQIQTDLTDPFDAYDLTGKRTETLQENEKGIQYPKGHLFIYPEHYHLHLIATNVSTTIATPTSDDPTMATSNNIDSIIAGDNTARRVIVDTSKRPKIPEFESMRTRSSTLASNYTNTGASTNSNYSYTSSLNGSEDVFNNFNESTTTTNSNTNINANNSGGNGINNSRVGSINRIGSGGSGNPNLYVESISCIIAGQRTFETRSDVKINYS